MNKLELRRAKLKHTYCLSPDQRQQNPFRISNRFISITSKPIVLFYLSFELLIQLLGWQVRIPMRQSHPTNYQGSTQTCQTMRSSSSVRHVGWAYKFCHLSSVYLFVCQSVYQFVCLSVGLFVQVRSNWVLKIGKKQNLQ